MHITNPIRLHANIPTIPDTNFDGSQVRSTFWLAVLAPVLMTATFLITLLNSNFSHIAGGLCFAMLILLIYYFPTQASARFITSHFKRPPQFIPTAIGLAMASTLAVFSAVQIESTNPIAVAANASGHFSALFLALSIATSGRYAFNVVAMTERLMVLLLCWGGCAVVDDFMLLAVCAVGFSINVLWTIQSRWIPQTNRAVIKTRM